MRKNKCCMSRLYKITDVSASFCAILQACVDCHFFLKHDINQYRHIRTCRKYTVRKIYENNTIPRQLL